MNLGRRLVALKVSRAEGDEPRILARLQHAHIVPVHSVQDEPATGLRLLCTTTENAARIVGNA